uniref:Reverse transcriptase domain-containing protein n=1 Tax=Tanacetum cinerariifolium TaxID=118510 RepID=A0A6L2L5K3_TANCI|nr:reverse transcriptase domain-containing protein [Tanacetum cinerariifolium]
MLIQPHDLDYVPETIYPEYIPLKDEHVLSAEEQPLPPIDSPTAESSGYVLESDPKEDPEEYEDDETKDGPINYPMDEGDDGDDDDGDSSGDDAGEKDKDEEDEEEHLAMADSAIVIPTAAISLPPEAEVERLLAMPTPPSSPLASLSPPSVGECLARCTASSALPSPPLPPPLYIPPPVDRMDDILETKMPPRKRFCLSTIGSMYEIRESFTARPIEGRGIDYGFVSTLDAEARRREIGEVGYGIRDTWVNPAEAVPKIVPMTVGEANTRVTELAELHGHDTQDLYALLEDAQDSKTRISQRVTMDSQWVKFATCTLLDAVLTWWNSQIRSLGPDAYSMTWEVLKKKITDKYCPQGEIKKLKIKLWNLKVKGNDVLTYTKCFQELNLICTKFVANETKKIDKYLSGLPNNIYRSVKASKPKTLDETIELAKDLMDQKLCTYAERQTNNKRKAGNSYDVELADGKIVGVDTIMRGCTLNFLNHSFNIDLIPAELGCFNVIIGTNWLRRCHAVIVCDEKLVRVPYGDETLIFYGDESNDGRKSRLTIISCSKAQEYMAKGCQIFLAQISAKKEEDKSEGKQLKDVPIV